MFRVWHIHLFLNKKLKCEILWKDKSLREILKVYAYYVVVNEWQDKDKLICIYLVKKNPGKNKIRSIYIIYFFVNIF